jgi:hypothetical protein
MRKRVNNFTGNVHTWLMLAELKIDYYTQFIKAWLPFNAWYVINYHSDTLNNDRMIIDEIKKVSNPFRDRIINLLIGNDSKSNDFRHCIGQLHFELEAHSIPNQDSRISFQSITIFKNTKTQSIHQFRKLHYKVTYDTKLPKSVKRLKCEIFDSSKSMINIYLDEFNDWSKEDLFDSSNYQLLSEERKEQLRLGFEEVNPFKPVNIIVKPLVHKSTGIYSKPSKCLIIDQDKNLYLIDDIELVAKAIIEILYRLRCALFHGELNPTETNQVIYERAYQILKILIQELK